jgi:hypothetical protein
VYKGEDRGELVMEVALPEMADPAGALLPGVILLRPVDPSWDESLAGVPRSVFHSAGYHLYTRGLGWGEPFLAIVGDATQGFAWPYLLRPIADVEGLEGTAATDVSSVYGYPGPLAWGCAPDGQFVEEAWSLIVETWRRQGAVSAFTRFNPLLENAALAHGLSVGRDDGGKGVIAAGPTVSVDLVLSDEAIHSGYGRDLNRQIAAGRRHGLTTVHDEAWDHLSTFTRLYHETMARIGASEFYYFSEDDFWRLRSSLGGDLHLLVTLKDSVVASAGLFIEYEGNVEWHLVGANALLRDLSPSKVLVDDSIRWARDRGNRVLHLGGGRGGREDSLFWFKSRFSPRRHQFYTGRWILEPRRYAELDSARRATLPASGGRDPDFFPAYRAPLFADRPR